MCDVFSLSIASTKVGLQPGVVSCSEVLRSLARRKQWQQTLKLLQEMRSRQVRVDTVCYNICIHACQGQWAQALGLFAELEGLLEPSEVSYGAVFVALGKGHRWLQVLAMLTSAVQGAKARVVYNTALGAFRDAHRWDLAIRMCEDPVVREHLDEVGWATVIAACAKAGKWSLGLMLTDQLRTHHKVTLQTYNWLLRGMRFDSGSWRAALSIVHDAMQKRLSPNAVTYTNLLHSWRQRGPWEKTLELFAELRQLDGAKAEAVSSVLAALERGHRLEATGVALDIKCFLRRQLKLGKAGFNNEAFHEAATLHSAWMGAGLPDAFGSAMHRVLVAPVWGAISGKAGTPSASQVVQNVHYFSAFDARIVGESASWSGTFGQIEGGGVGARC
ncbi:unnamed protein product [Effrenium voratum]|uniref:Pentatricopeptide repeat-containing protein n=1 Tax=Effrenium voratum TaxID=2562239 RepID=A0AA36JF89_9DINO|nr:unnamed protein product [Effrenium voratum]